MALIDITGQKFEHCTALRFLPELGTDRGAKFLFRCECGKEFVARSNDVRKGRVKSCGCVNRVERAAAVTKHGFWKHPTYTAWIHIKDRCNNPRNAEFEHYGGRGIKICEEWANDSGAFCRWSMANGWKKGLTIDRIDVNGDYEPDNCRWVSMEVQQNNKRNNHIIEFCGEKMSLSQLAHKTGVSRNRLYYRIVVKGMSAEVAVSRANQRISRKGKNG
jgi:hypothetical protein